MKKEVRKKKLPRGWRILSGILTMTLTMGNMMPTVQAQELSLEERMLLATDEFIETESEETSETNTAEDFFDEIGNDTKTDDEVVSDDFTADEEAAEEGETKPDNEADSEDVPVTNESTEGIEESVEEDILSEDSASCIIAEDIFADMELEDQEMHAYLGELMVTVRGYMPKDSKLVVRAEELTETVKEQLIAASSIVENRQDLETAPLLYSYDISILHQDVEYEPYLFDKSIEVTFSFVQRQALAEVSRVEVFHVNAAEQLDAVAVKQVTEHEIVVDAVEFSQYIVVGEVSYGGKKAWNYDFAEGLINFQAPEQGIYRVTLYGAQGEHYGKYTGGKGGMVISYVELMKDQPISFIIGSQSGYNGGGAGTLTHGGGATELYVDGKLAAVAGGGGGALAGMNGGLGGEVRGAQMPSSQGQSSTAPSTAGGGGGFLGGAAGQDFFHVHSGDEMTEGGCYMQRLFHEHVHEPSCFIASGCGKIEGERYEEEGIERYVLSCGMTEASIEYSEKSCGGRNYYDSNICQDVVAVTGMNVGNGRVEVSLTQLYAGTVYYYNHDASLLGKISVTVGDTAGCPVSEYPHKEADSRYAYVFAGWDDMATPEVEFLSSEQTTEAAVWDDRSYRAVYDEIPQQYQLFLNNGFAEYAGTTQVTAAYGQPLPPIEIPRKDGFIFQGYYTQEAGNGKQIYTADGMAREKSDFMADSTLHAHWHNPIVILRQPEDVIVFVEYEQARTELEAAAAQGYTLAYQWLLDEKEVEGANANVFSIPTGYRSGSYDLLCRITATSAWNGQQVMTQSDKAVFRVEKGTLQDADIIKSDRVYDYDAKPHKIAVDIHKPADFVIYYAEEPLQADNYHRVGRTEPFSYIEAGNYSNYYYAVSDNYLDYAGMATMEIKPVKPTIFLGGKNASYNKEPQHMDHAIVYGVDGSELETEIFYTYYTDAACQTLTQKQDGALTEGGAPSKIGTYYCVAETKEMPNYLAAKTTVPAVLNIVGTHVAFSVEDYVGIYDGKEHGLNVTVEDEERVTFWYSDTEALTKDNYQTIGTTQPYAYAEVGEYDVYYLAATKILGFINYYQPGSAKIIIKPVEQNIDSRPENGEPNKNENTGGSDKDEHNNNAGSSDKNDNSSNSTGNSDKNENAGGLNKNDNINENASDSDKNKHNGNGESNLTPNNQDITSNQTQSSVNKKPNAETSQTSKENADSANSLINADNTDMITVNTNNPTQEPTIKDEPDTSITEQTEDNTKSPKHNQTLLHLLLLLLLVLGIAALCRFLLYPLWKKRQYYISGHLTGMAQSMRVAIDTQLTQKQVSYDREGNFAFKGLEKDREYTITLKGREGYPIAEIRVTLNDQDSEYEIVDNKGLQLQIYVEKRGVKIIAR